VLEPSWLEAVTLAQANNLSAYDASYLQLAVELHVPLATFDTRLARAASALGLTVLG
jgi:predicted nucleic acid-binding protein